MRRRFLPTGGGVEPSSSSSSSGQRAGEAAAGGPGLRFGGGDISLGPHGGGGGGGGGGGHHDGSVDLLGRHSSSPAGFFSNLMVSNGFPGSKAGAGSGAEAQHPSMANNSGSGSSGGRKMKSQLSFTGGPSHLSHISEVDGAFHDRAGHSGESSVPRSFSAGGGSSGGGFSIVGPWEESRDIIATLGGYESQFGGMASTSALEMAGMDKYLQLQHDQVPFKVRAKRGCATHPRSIAERERRTRISEKLRKLQELVPNMDKQTSTADMLDLAVEHIKGLQSQLQALKHEQEKCTCCSSRP
ncbi:hypothetical protein GUJ93_ZPchr0006g43616 [Zizania palustris]|uniref:BHLH domain-containing protein n=1 Tax=Zizania palustris TaxID=103762 RepID=A0A8J5W1S3_ZIZPA|nr:hypothetical protein GUJ93_ZPchr0006g43616 [Zizania palustris]